MPARGTAKAIVLPLPVRARPRTSRPASASGRVADWMGNGVVIPVRASAAAIGAGHTQRGERRRLRCGRLRARPVAAREVGVRRVAAAAARDAIRGCGADGRHHGAWGTKVFLSRAVRPWMLRLHAHRAGNHGRTKRPHFRPRQPSWGWRPAHPTGSEPRTSAAAAGMGVETRVDSWPRTTGFGFASWRSWSVSRP